MAASLSSRSDDRAAAALASAVASLGGNSESFARNAAAHAVSVVLVPQGRGDATAAARTLMSQLGAAPGLEYVTSNASGTFWRVRPAKQATSRLRVEAGGASTPLASGVASAQADVPQSETARLLVLAERADPGWTANPQRPRTAADRPRMAAGVAPARGRRDRRRLLRRGLGRDDRLGPGGHPVRGARRRAAPAS